VGEDGVGDSCQLRRLGVVLGQRLVTAIAAGHDQERRPISQEELVQRRRRQHHPDVAQEAALA